MAARRLDGAALLVAGHGTQGGTALDASGVHTLGQIGEALLATGASWQIRRLTATAGERYTADRASLKRNLDELIAEEARVVVIVVLGTIVEHQGEPALVTGPQAREYPEDATLPLAWIRDRLLAAKAEQVVLVLSAQGDAAPRAWLTALATRSPRHLIAVEAPASGAPLADAVLAGLCGEALDPRTGTVTMASLGTYLAERAPASVRQLCDASETIAQPPPLAGLWDVRRSQLSARGTRPRTPRSPPTDDLTGSVLPGRFRVDSLVARGTFGTVYRARQLAVERDVALKVLHADIDPSSEDGRLFVHEIRSVGRIDHANVVRIYQADITHDGRLFFAMELLDGRDLHTVIQDGKMPRPRAIDLTRQLLAGLGAAHDAGLVHADVKPANALVVERDGAERLVLVDFGLSRLRAPDRPSASAGGTPAYMPPEQMMEGRVDARSDLYSAALVLVHLLTGWRRPNAFTLTPPFEMIEDAGLRAVLRRALAADPAKRYASARELAAALDDTSAPAPDDPPPPPVLPFRHLAALTESDRGRLHGREDDLAVLIEHVLYRRSVIYTAPSGAGKTSMLRAGLLPRLDALGIQAIYVRCRADSTAAIAAAISPDGETIAGAITLWHQRHRKKLVIVLDQLEAALVDARSGTLVREMLGYDTWPADADVSVVLSIREDYLARLVTRSQDLEPGIPIVRLPPLTPEGARAAIVGPLTESRLAIEPELLDVLLADLQKAAAAIGAEMGWGTGAAVYPPHLQLACSVLYEALGAGEVTLTLAHYKRLGGFEAIVGEHLERVLETELADGRDVIARDLFLALVTGGERAMRGEAELIEIGSARHEAHEVKAVLESLRSRGLLVRVRDAAGEPAFELVHDSLVKRVLAWIDRRDLARRRAVELVRYHLRRSRPDAPSLLGRAELRELAPHADAIAELDAEWAKRDAAPDAWTPAKLIARSRQAIRRRVTTIAAAGVALVAIASVGFYASHVEREHSAHEASLRARDLGRFTLSLEPFDWDPVALKATRVPATLALTWTLHAPDPADPAAPGAPLAEAHVVRGTPHLEGDTLIEAVEAHGGPAFLVVARTDCTPSIVPLRALPGYTQREHAAPVLHVRVPTCQATLADTIAIPAGAFLYGGVGDPPSKDVAEDPSSPPERRLELPAFRIDRTEVTNAAFELFAAMSSITGIAGPSYPTTAAAYLKAREPNMPAAAIDWFSARALCRFFGKDLPTSPQWTRALRGGERLPDGSLNPAPRRNFPWGTSLPEKPANLSHTFDVNAPVAVGTFPLDRSPDGVFDLAGNVYEWTSSIPPGEAPSAGLRVIRGGNWAEGDLTTLVEFMAIENPRAAVQITYVLGARCAGAPK